MTRPLAVLRPEPGNAATVDAVEAAGLTAIALPLFAVRAVAWAAPDPADYGALIVTSANTMRLGGAALEALRSLPVLAVGEATAVAARAAGFRVELVGKGGAAAIAKQGGGRRLLHLAGRDRMETGVDTITVYASDALPIDATRLLGNVALVHSARAAARLAEIATDRSRIAVAAISLNAAASAGEGWAALAVASTPNDAAVIAAARGIAD